MADCEVIERPILRIYNRHMNFSSHSSAVKEKFHDMDRYHEAADYKHSPSIV